MKQAFSLFSRTVVSPFIRPAVEAMLEAEARNIPRMSQRRALERTVDFIDQHMPTIQSFPDRGRLLEHALSRFAPAARGLICEFGVYQADTLRFIAERVDQPVFGFDSFEGLPEDWVDSLPRGHFKLDELPEVPANVTLIKGWFADTLGEFVASHPGDALFLHIDSDLYSSCKTVCDAFAARIVPGTVIVFDEYFNYPGWEHGEHRAFRESVARYGWAFEYLGYVAHAEQLAIRITGVRPS